MTFLNVEERIVAKMCKSFHMVGNKDGLQLSSPLIFMLGGDLSFDRLVFHIIYSASKLSGSIKMFV